jgi:predicted aspartyl protease
VEFPLLRQATPFGPIPEPSLLLEVRTIAGYRGHRFLIDTGAEFSVAPRSLAQEVGLDLDSLPLVPTVGVGPGRLSARLGAITIRIGEVELSVRCLFMDHGLKPYILGRADVLDRFVLTIDAGRGTIALTEIP